MSQMSRDESHITQRALSSPEFSKDPAVYKDVPQDESDSSNLRGCIPIRTLLQTEWKVFI